MEEKYIHGYSEEEQSRLKTQNSILAKYIYERCPFGLQQRILEVGCGVGAQMEYVLKNYAPSQLTGVDISFEQIEQAEINLSHLDQNQYHLYNGSIDSYQSSQPFDSLLIVWVLEHVADPKLLLKQSLKHLKSGGNVFVTEVDHQSLQIANASDKIYELWQASIDYQSNLDGNAAIGQQLEELMQSTGLLASFEVMPYLMYFDQDNHIQRDVMLTYLVDLLKSAALPMIADKHIDEGLWLAAKSDLQTLVGKSDSVFSYSFMQGIGTVA